MIRLIAMVGILAFLHACEGNVEVSRTTNTEADASDSEGDEDSESSGSTSNDSISWTTKLSDQSTAEDAELSLTVGASSEAGSVTYALDTAGMTCDDGAWSPDIAINSSTGALSGTPTNDDVGSCTVAVSATDGSEVISSTATLTITNTDDAPTWQSTIADFTQSIDVALSGKIAQATEIDASDTIVYSLDTANMTCDDGSWSPTVSIDSSTGVLSGTPGAADLGGSCTIRVVATSGGVSINDDITVTVSSPYAVRVGLTADMSIPNNSYTAITWDREDFDNPTMHDNATNPSRLIARRAGKYLVTANIAFVNDISGGGVNCRLELRLNGGGAFISEEKLRPYNNCSIDVAGIYEFALNDYVEVRVRQNSGGAEDIDASASTSAAMIFLEDDDGARVTQSAPQSIPDSATTVLAFDSEQYDTNSLHDNATNNSRLTAQTAGYYLINGTGGSEPNATGYRQMGFAYNGTSFFDFTYQADASLDVHQDITALRYLDVGDYVEMTAFQNRGSPLDNRPDTYFVMHRLQDSSQRAEVSLSANQSVASGAAHAINWGAESYDPASMHDNASNNTRLTIQENGYYFVGVRVEFVEDLGTASERYLRIKVNNLEEIQVRDTTNTNSEYEAGTMLFLSAGDYVEAEVYQDTGSSRTLAQGEGTRFYLHKIADQ